jgi:hypothetical protein
VELKVNPCALLLLVVVVVVKKEEWQQPKGWSAVTSFKDEYADSRTKPPRQLLLGLLLLLLLLLLLRLPLAAEESPCW